MPLPSIPSAPTAVVTGASSGIGAAVTVRLLEAGYSVLALGRRRPSCGHSAALVHEPVDLADLEALAGVLSRLAAAHPAPDLLVLAAGAGLFGSLEEMSAEQIRRCFELNAVAPILVCRAFLPAMKRRGGGQVVLLGSESALRGRREGTVYSASKFALRGFAQALRDEVARRGVRVTIVHPGAVRTAFFGALDFEPGEGDAAALSPDDVADCVMSVASASSRAVVDEIELSPLSRVFRKKRTAATGSAS